MPKKITRQEESMLPIFENHKKAREWFKNEYGEMFILTGSEEIGEEKCYFYVLILNDKDYKNGIQEMQENGFVEGMEFLRSYQPVQIMESGIVHIVH